MDKPKVIVVLGPNASGKSDLAVNLVRFIIKNKKRFSIKGAEIISADSRQVYRGMDIGTGKISKKEMNGVPHHLLDIVSPSTIFTVARYQKLGNDAIKKIISRNKIPIICGGTGFYIRAITEGMRIPEVKPDLVLRKKLSSMSTDKLFNLLKKLDSRRAGNIDEKNPVRLIRAIEIATKLGSVPALENTKPQYNVLYIGTKISRDKLKERIHNRLLRRIDEGMIDEAKKLHKQGVSWKRMEQIGLEYRYLSRYLRKLITRDEMIKQLESEIVSYAKRQMTWWKKDNSINWFNKKQLPAIKQTVVKFLSD